MGVERQRRGERGREGGERGREGGGSSEGRGKSIVKGESLLTIRAKIITRTLK